MGLGVGECTSVQELTHTGCWVDGVEQGSCGVAVEAAQDLVRGCGERDHDRALQGVEPLGSREQGAASQRDHPRGVGAAQQAPQQLALSRPKPRLPLALEDRPHGLPGAALELGSLTREREGVLPRSITRKDGRRVVYVTADAVGISPADAVFAIQGSLRDDPLPAGYETELGGEGEWKITLDVFRDLGIAFAAALVGIYVVLVGQTRSLLLPVVMMVAIPITAIGIFPGFWLINLV